MNAHPKQILMKATRTSLFFFFGLFLLVTSSACSNTAPSLAPAMETPIPATQTPAPTLAATDTPFPTEPPPTATATEIPPSPTPAIRIFDFRKMNDIVLTFDLLSPETLNARTLFGGTTSYQSTDGGITWNIVKPAPDFAEIQQSLQGEFFWRDPQTPTTLYGISEATMSLMKSVDSGQTWTPLPLLDVMALAIGGGIFEIDPRNSNTLYVTSFSGIYKSGDGGLTWHEVSGLPEPGPSGLNIQQFIFDPSLSNTVYALDIGGWGAFKSTDGGEHWVCLCVSQGQASFYAKWLVIDTLNSNFLYAQNSIDGQIYTSPDGGQTWTVTDLGLPTSDISIFAIDPLNSSIRYAVLGTGEFSGFFKSTDGGQTWAEITTAFLP